MLIDGRLVVHPITVEEGHAPDEHDVMLPPSSAPQVGAGQRRDWVASQPV